MKPRLHIVFIFLSLLLFSCKKEISLPYQIENFKVLTNWEKENSDSIKILFLDYSEALQGFLIPSTNQVPGGHFSFSFQIKNNGNAEEFFL